MRCGRAFGVNDAQVAAVEKILADAKKRYDDLRREQRPMRDHIQQEQVDAIRAVLTDAQKPAYDAWRAERAKRSKTGASGSSGSASAKLSRETRQKKQPTKPADKRKGRHPVKEPPF